MDIYVKCLFCLILFNLNGFGQNSFQITPELKLNPLIDLSVNENNEIILLSQDSFIAQTPFLYLTEINAGANIKDGFQLLVSANQPIITLRTKFQGNRFFGLLNMDKLSPPFGASSVMVAFDFNTQTAWARNRSAEPAAADFAINNNEEIILFRTTLSNPQISELFSLNTSGQTIWKKGIQFFNNNFPSFRIRANNIAAFPSNKLLLLGHFFDTQTTFKTPFIMELEEDGTPLLYKTILNSDLENLIVSTDNHVFLLGKTKEKFPFTENCENTILIKMDIDLNLLWAKVYHAESFEYSKTSLSVFEDGSLVLAYSTFGAFPTILAKLNPEGDILWEKGYPLYEPEIKVMPNGSLIMLTKRHFDANGQLSFKQIISKTDVDGKIDGCETFPTCLQTNDVTIEFGNFSIEDIDIEDLDTLEVQVEPFQFSFSDFCDTPPPPNPEFYFPDTLCLGDCVQSTDTYNHFAHGIEWQLTGAHTDSLLRDSFHFNYCFSEAGEYTLRQTIWFLGCDYSYEHTVTVLEDLEINILPDEVICEDPPFVLEVESSRELHQYLWNGGSTEPYLEIFEGGVYGLQANDGFCEGVDSIEVRFISELISEEVILLPNDTVVCVAHLPYILVPQSPFSESFQLNDSPNEAAFFEIAQPGEYQISTIVEGCLFQKTFKLETDECLVPVYLPNIFSPNGDGLNDTFSPMGNDFEAVQLSIYDRWGGQVFEEAGGFLSWDGKLEGKAQPAGVYVYIFQYINTLTGEFLELSGDVTLVR